MASRFRWDGEMNFIRMYKGFPKKSHLANLNKVTLPGLSGKYREDVLLLHKRHELFANISVVIEPIEGFSTNTDS